jgi:hypothetical protein
VRTNTCPVFSGSSISGTEFIGLSASWAADQYLSGFSRSPISATEITGLSAARGADQYLSGFSRSPMPNLGKRLRTARARVAQIAGSANNKTFPGVSKSAIFNERAVVKLTKMVGYQAESDLLALLRPHYAPAPNRHRHRTFCVTVCQEV